MSQVLWSSVSLVVAPLAFVGLVLATYFTLVTYRLVRPDSPWLPRVCRLDEGTCARVVDTPDARVLGLPNSVFGAVYYAVLLALPAAPTVAALLAPALLVAATGAALLSVYLAWALLRKLRVVCVLCFAAHGVNVALAGVHWVFLGPTVLGLAGA